MSLPWKKPRPCVDCHTPNGSKGKSVWHSCSTVRSSARQGVSQPFLTALDEVRPGQQPYSEGFEPGSYSRGSARGMTDVNLSYPPPCLAKTETQVCYTVRPFSLLLFLCFIRV